MGIHEELIALNKEIGEREDSINNEWLKTHEIKPGMRGQIEPLKKKELMLEAKRRYGEILEKYNGK